MYGIDVIMGCKHQTDFRQVEAGKGFNDIFGRREERHSSVAYNVHNKKEQVPYRGTGAMEFHLVSNYAWANPRSNTTGLGRWTSMVVKCGPQVVRIVVAYRPCFSSHLQ